MMHVAGETTILVEFSSGIFLFAFYYTSWKISNIHERENGPVNFHHPDNSWSLIITGS